MTRILALLVIAAATAGSAADPAWPQFRGPGGLGIADGQNLPTKFGTDTNVKWKVPVPPGFSSPVIAGDRLFLTAFEDGKLYTIAYALADGKELWRKHAAAKKIEPYHKTEGSPAASTPVTDGERVVAYFGSCGLVCYDLDGKEQWKFELPSAVTNSEFGSGTSPLLVDGKVVLARDLAKESKLYVIDAKSGSLVWDKKRDGFPTAYASPCVWDTPAGKQLVVPGAFKLTAYSLKDGDLTWTLPNTPAVPCTTPVVVDGKLIYAGWSPGGNDFKMPSFDDILKQGDKDGDGALSKDEVDQTFLKGFFENNDTNKDGKITRDEWDAVIKFMSAGKNVAVSISPGGTGDISKSHVNWTATKGLPYVPSPVVYKGLLYTINMRGRLTAHDAKTGKEVYEDEQVGLNGGVYASPLAADGNLYLFGLDKSVVVVKAGDSPDKVSAAKLDDRIAASPAAAGGVLYVRTGKTLFAFAEKK